MTDQEEIGEYPNGAPLVVSEDLRADDIAPVADDGEEGPADKCQTTNTQKKKQKTPKFGYNPKKPNWWIKLCRRPTKYQKKAINEILPTHRLPLIPYDSFLDWSTIFRSDVTDIWVEIGFGRGENLLALAHRKHSENVAFVGAEIHRAGTAMACTRIQQGLEQARYWSDYILYSPSLDPYSNDSGNPSKANCTEKNDVSCERMPYEKCRLCPTDGMKLLSQTPSSSLAVVLVTFPDPFPKYGDEQLRVIQPGTLREIHRVLRKSTSNPGRFFLATDHDGFFQWSLEQMDQVNHETTIFEALDPYPDRLEWLPAISRYEQKGWEEGRRTNLACWTAKDQVC